MGRGDPSVSAYEVGYWTRPSPWSPRSWSRKVWIWVGTGIVVVVAAVVGAVVGVRLAKGGGGSYPNYSRLNYTLIDTYSGTSFFDKFNYFHDYDPTFGFVHYVDPDYAATYNLTYASPSTAIVRVDTSVGPDSDPNASTGRFSVRLESKAQYGPGLFLFDVKHTPYGCGTWPALWLTDTSNWPTNGEIDLLESVNLASSGRPTIALHTTSGCSMDDVRREMSGSVEGGHVDCYNGTDNNAGCAVSGPPATYGAEFNERGGGVVALEWRVEGVRVWGFPRGRGGDGKGVTAVPPPEGGMLDPSSWGLPVADFPGTKCDVAGHFRNQSIVVNIDLCGVLTEALWEGSGCGSVSCHYFVANRPAEFKNAFWEFGAFQVYKAL
ncbi:glycoside hydrolase [Staphylotrichum tortipilum]|uniref:Glycoside hydrolase n=1 Tax=Staphylotrichum tortipilum TaxID=2831512 RepID=A0AAN6MKZ8_9PEZI|nr:glycoside hydrolase [Staphylotrichum longicolle]